MSDDEMIKWLHDAARYFEKRPTVGEDQAHWANVYNAENCRKIADRIATLEAEVERLRTETITIKLSPLTEAQRRYVEQIQEAQNYDPSAVVGGPRGEPYTEEPPGYPPREGRKMP